MTSARNAEVVQLARAAVIHAANRQDDPQALVDFVIGVDNDDIRLVAAVLAQWYTNALAYLRIERDRGLSLREAMQHVAADAYAEIEQDLGTREDAS